MTKYKVCNKCGQEKLLTSTYFYKSKKNTDGFYGQCKSCTEKVKKAYREKNKERLYKAKREWNKNNPRIIRIFKQRRKNLKANTLNTLTFGEYEIILKQFNYSCAYCGMSREEHLKTYQEELHQDHLVPMSKGGGYTKWNIIPSCRTCNSKKHNTDFEEWYKSYEFYCKIRLDKILEVTEYKENKQISMI